MAPSEDEPAEEEAKSDGDEEKPAEDAAPEGDGGEDEPAADIIHKDLAEQVPQPEWVYEGEGSGKEGAGGVEIDPRLMNRKIRRMGRVTLAGAGIALVGAAVAISGAIMLFGVNPKKKLSNLASDNMGVLPVDDDKRHRYISIARAAPIVTFTGLGVLGAGIITAAIARIRLKKLREQRRTSIVAVVPTLYGQGAELHWEVSF